MLIEILRKFVVRKEYGTKDKGMNGKRSGLIARSEKQNYSENQH